MLPAVYKLLHDQSAVRDLVGTRIYRHGDAPQQGAMLPYVTWQLISSIPENLVSGDTPPIDAMSVQVNCWSDDDEEVEELGGAVRAAIETAHHVTEGPTNGRDTETLRFRMTLIFTFWNFRPDDPDSN